MKYITTIGEREFMVEIVDERHVSVNGKLYEVDFAPVSNQPVYSLILDGHSYEAYVYETEDAWQVLLHGELHNARVEDEREKRLRAASGSRQSDRGEFILRAPMPGLIVSIPVGEGQKVSKGDVLLILESMKMQNELKAPRDGIVSRLRVEPGDNVELKQVLLSLV
jgi:biotin carboxyl carrier protein